MKKLSQIIATIFFLTYMASPIDVVPDIPVVGWVDDPIMLALMLWASGFFEEEKKEVPTTYKVIDAHKLEG